MIDEKSKILCGFLVHSSCLSICLWMICCGQISNDSSELVKVFHELCCKLRSLITNDLLREPMFTPHMVSVDASGSLCGEFHLCGDDNDHF